MPDPLEYLWPHMDVPHPLLSRQLVVQWPDHAFDRLLAAGFIRETGIADRVGCPVCHGAHKEEVIAQQVDGICQYFVYCPVVLRAEVTADDLRQWTIDFEAFAKALAGAMGLHGRCSALLPERLWCLGWTAWHGQRRKVLFVRGLEWNDALIVIAQIRSHCRPVVLMTYRAPLECPSWLIDLPTPVPLEEVASLGEYGISLDGAVMAAMIDEADAMVDVDNGRPPNDIHLKRLVRRQVKAERKTELADDLLVAAYKQEGSYRKAAAALVAANMPTNPWAVRRAVDRAGGVSAVRRR